jgi:hypothetical protein
MTSMRTDGDASAKLWAKRLGKLIDAINEDDGAVYVNTDTMDIAVSKGDSVWTSMGTDVSSER